jgi:hypothetical protein
MTDPARAFAPGSPAASPSKVLNLPGGSGVLPPLNFSSASSASGHSQSAFDNSGFVVNYGGGVSTGVPGWLLIVGAVAAGVLLWRRAR